MLLDNRLGWAQKRLKAIVTGGTGELPLARTRWMLLDNRLGWAQKRLKAIVTAGTGELPLARYYSWTQGSENFHGNYSQYSLSSAIICRRYNFFYLLT